MVKSCCACGCTNRQVTGSGLGFYRIPTELERRAKCIQTIRREGWDPSATDRLCCAHFITGKPNSQDKDHPDYVPSIFKFKDSSGVKSGKALKRFERSVSIRKRRESVITSPTVEQTEESEYCEAVSDEVENDDVTHRGLQTDGDVDVIQQNVKLSEEVKNLREERDMLKAEMEKLKFSWQGIQADDKKTVFYTGLQSFSLFEILFSYVSAKMEVTETKLHLKDELLLVLMKLRLDLPFEDLGDRFGISRSTASRLFHKWLPVLHVRLEPLIRWPDKETTLQTLSSRFQKHFRKVRCVIDCSEIFIERPNAVKARSQTFSNYKKHNTVKILIGVTPSGTISFLSQCFGGKISDKEITKRSGFYEKLVYGDIVLAGRGFLIADELALRGFELLIPSFTRGKKQLSQQEVEMSRRLSRARIHIERIIGLQKKKTNTPSWEEFCRSA